MSDVIHCSACLGQKTIMGMGMMSKTCGYCHGIGYIEKEKPQATSVVSAAPANIPNIHDDNRPIIAKKRGRPRKLEAIHAV